MDTSARFIRNMTGNISERALEPLLHSFPLIEPEFFNAYNIYLYIMVVLGIFGNVIVLVVFLYNRPSTTTDWFILFITVCDFISSLINVPVYATFTNGYWQIYGNTVICRLHMFLSQSIVLSSSFLICGLALDRYFKICRQISSFNKVFARNACLVITAVTTVLSIPALVMFENRASRCVSIVMDTTLFAYYLLVFLIFIFATAVVVFSYYKVTKTVVNSAANIARHADNTETADIRKTCCLIPFFRSNRVLPATSTMSRGNLFGGNSNSAGSASIQDQTKDHLHPPRHLSPIPRRLEVIKSGNSEQGTSSADRMPSVSVSNNQRPRNSASLRTTKISFIVCSIFILTWIPPWLCFVLASIPGMRTNISVIKFMIFGRMTYLINGFSNPIIYTLLNKRFRNRIFEIFCCCK